MSDREIERARRILSTAARLARANPDLRPIVLRAKAEVDLIEAETQALEALETTAGDRGET